MSALDFRAAGGKWLIVHLWLRHGGRLNEQIFAGSYINVPGMITLSTGWKGVDETYFFFNLPLYAFHPEGLIVVAVGAAMATFLGLYLLIRGRGIGGALAN